MLATDPSSPARRSDRARCPHCDATPGGCDGLHWLAGRWCCTACTGTHDAGQPSGATA